MFTGLSLMADETFITIISNVGVLLAVIFSVRRLFRDNKDAIMAEIETKFGVYLEKIENQEKTFLVRMQAYKDVLGERMETFEKTNVIYREANKGELMVMVENLNKDLLRLEIAIKELHERIDRRRDEFRANQVPANRANIERA